MKTKNYSNIKRNLNTAKATFVALIFLIFIHRNANAQCLANLTLDPIETSCGATSVDLLNSINVGLASLGIGLNNLTITVYTDDALQNLLTSGTVVNTSGTYYIKVVNALSICAAKLQITVTFKRNPIASASHTDILCYGGASTVTITAGDGKFPYTGTGNFSQYTADGDKTYTVTDANGCTGDVTVTAIDQPSDISFAPYPAGYKDSIQCVNWGRSVLADFSGGTAPYTFSLNNGPYQVSDTFFNNPAGTYVMRIKDANGCIKIGDPIVIKQPAARLTVTASSAQTSCNISNITVTAKNGWGNYVYSVNGGAFQSSNVFGGFAPGQDSISVKDVGGCIVGTKITIVPSNLSATLAASGGVDSVICVGWSRSIIASGHGGILPYTYSADGGSNYQNSAVFLKQAGSYAITVKDGVGCTVLTNTLNVRQPATAISVSATSSPVSCNNSTVTVTGAGGWGGYIYSLNNRAYQSSNIFTNLSTGSDSIKIMDNAGCIAKGKITIAPSDLSATLAPAAGLDSLPCYGWTRSIITSAHGGVSPYTYSVDGGSNYQSGAVFIKPAGSYTVTVKDAIGCTALTNVTTIKQPATAVSFTASSAQVTCDVSTLTITGAGGAGGYTYSLNNSALQASNMFTNLSPGSDSVRVQDKSGCTTYGKVIIAPANLSAQLSAAQGLDSLTCYGWTRTIFTTPHGGTAPYTYSFDGGTNYLTYGYSVKPAGSYTVTVKDAVGCMATSNILILKQPSALLAFTSNTTNVSCDNNTVTLAVSGGYGNYTFSLDSITYQASNVFSNLPSGSYPITVKDNAGCVKGKTVVIAPPASPCSGFTGVTGQPNGVTASNANTSYALSKTAVGTGLALKLNAYPNPSPSSFTLRLEGSSVKPTIQVRVTDMYGKVVFLASGPAQKTYSFGERFISGIYIVQLIDGTNTQSIKLVKAR